jgi:hypothetical protein
MGGGQYQDIQTAHPDITFYISNHSVYCIEDQNLTHTT